MKFSHRNTTQYVYWIIFSFSRHGAFKIFVYLTTKFRIVIQLCFDDVFLNRVKVHINFPTVGHCNITSSWEFAIARWYMYHIWTRREFSGLFLVKILERQKSLNFSQNPFPYTACAQLSKNRPDHTMAYSHFNVFWCKKYCLLTVIFLIEFKYISPFGEKIQFEWAIYVKYSHSYTYKQMVLFSYMHYIRAPWNLKINMNLEPN